MLIGTFWILQHNRRKKIPCWPQNMLLSLNTILSLQRFLIAWWSVSSGEVSLIQWRRAYYVRQEKSFEVRLIMWGWPHSIRLASSCEAGPILWGRLHPGRQTHPVRLTISLEASFIISGNLSSETGLMLWAWPPLLNMASFFEADHNLQGWPYWA